jgi:hypothetical protein
MRTKVNVKSQSSHMEEGPPGNREGKKSFAGMG